MPELALDDMHTLVSKAVLGPDFLRATFGGASRQGKCAWKRVLIRPVDLAGNHHLQFSYFDEKKDVTKNYKPGEAAGHLAQVLALRFAGVHVSTRTEEIDLHVTKKGKVLVGRKAVASPAAPPPAAHNRVKDLPLPEGRADRVLEAMGVMTRDGHVRPTMRDKFAQINAFLQLLGHVAKDALSDLGRPVEILDCGCGSSYLTIAAHHYLNAVLQLPACVIGVDVNEEVIRKSVERAERLGAEGLAFRKAQIGAADDVRPDVVLALHACDTATDDAIALAVAAGARVLLSVPCCHHDLNTGLTAGEGDVLRPVTRHGILKQRLADLTTDAFRALALRVMGYKTDVIEFVSAEHTARNLMIRAVKGARVGEPEFVEEFRRLKAFFRVTPHIENAIPDLARLVAG